MTISEQTNAPAAVPDQAAGPDDSLGRDILVAARYYLGGRRTIFIMIGIAAAAGLALNWSWLVAVGLAPILIGILPCAVMCGLGLCMNRLMGRSCESNAQGPSGVSADSSESAVSEVIEASASVDAADSVASAIPQPKGDDNA